MNLADGSFSGLAGPEIDVFSKCLKGLSGKGVEIGCLDGCSTVVILSCSYLDLVSIDPFVPDSMEPSLIGREHLWRKNTEAFGSRSILIRDFSQNVHHQFENSILDFLFIDGDHTELAVFRDYDQWVPKLKPGGILAVHDSRMYRKGGAPFHEGPSKLTRDRVYDSPEWEILDEAFSLTVAKKV